LSIISYDAPPIDISVKFNTFPEMFYDESAEGVYD